MAVIEAPSRIEPCLLDEVGAGIVDLVSAISSASQALGMRLHPRSAESLADLVRVMNCYYSNLIEGHNTTPREIESALADRLDSTEERRNLQIEARAHIRLQREIDRRFAAGDLPEAASMPFIRWLHRSFYDDAPEAMLSITTMEHFERRYRFDGMGAGTRITAIPAAHHRLNYIHPFLDGNGRVSRLMSHAMALQAGIGAHGLWSVSRGLARGLESRGDYKRMMDHADMPRQGDLDGRGNLSRRALADFTTWFLQVCLDQITFMTGLFELETLIGRLRLYVGQRGLRGEAVPLLQHVLQRGEMPRGDAPRAAGLKERAARDLLAALVGDGILGSETPKGAVSLRFPQHTVEILFPSLFPRA